MQGRPPRPKPSTAPRRAKPRGRKEDPLPAVRIKSGGSSKSSPPGPAFSLQREYLSLTVVAQGGPLGGSWSGLLSLSYTSRGRKPKIRSLTSSPWRASWCLESRLTHHHGITHRSPPHFVVKLNEAPVPYVDTVKYLGVFIVFINSRTNCVDPSAALRKFFGCFNNIMSVLVWQRWNVSCVFSENLLLTYFIIWLWDLAHVFFRQA